MNLEDIPIPDMIHFHKQTSDILFTNLLKSTLKLSKLEVTKSKIENQLRQEKVENRAHQAQIKKLQEDIIAARGQVDKGQGMKKLSDEKENAIQLLKNKLKIPSTQLIEGPELAKIEKEKECLKNELMDCKARLLKFVDKEKQWKKDIALVV